MKVCFIGNSHLGAVKRGFDLMSIKEVEATFFAYGGKGLRTLEARGDAVVSSSKKVASGLSFTSGGVSSIRPADYDFVVIYALDFHAWFPKNFVDYTRAALKQACKDNFFNSSCGYVFKEIADALKATSDSPRVVIASSPFPSRGVGCPAEVFDAHYRMANDYYSGVMDDVGCFFYYPPRQVLDGCEFTSLEYSRGSRKLATGDEEDDELHDSKDVNHMNADYGKIWCESLFGKITQKL